MVATEFPYRPVVNLQFWFAAVAYVPQSDWDAMPPNDYPVYSPPLVIEVLSPSNTPAKINRQRIIAMSAGTQEFWVVDPDNRTVQITDQRGTNVYECGSIIPLTLFGGTGLAVDAIFSQ